MTQQTLRPADLSELLGVPLSKEQLEAATADLAPGLIVAGAGSGKTTVMAARVVWLVGTGQVPAAGVLGLTFTNKAAAELLQRIRSALRRLSAAASDAADDPLVATYHSFAGQLLREFGLLIGVEPAAALMSPVRQRQLARAVVARADVDPGRLGVSPQDAAAAMLALDSLLADNDVAVADLLAFDADMARALQARDGQQRIGERMLATAAARCELAELVAQYRSAKRERELLDFADYVRLGAHLCRRHPEVGAVLRQRHGAVLLDEYQDTSVAQRGMLQALFGVGHPVTAVGDPCQAIYGWRGASPHNMDAFPQHFPTAQGPPARRYSLATNRRSGAHILQLANDAAADLRAVHQGVAALRPDPRTGPGEVTAGLLPTVADELDWLVDQVRGADVAWREIAVLARTNDGAADVVGALRGAGIPVQVHGKQPLLALPEVRWVIWALRLAADPTANDALVGILMGPAWRIGLRDLAILARRASDLATDPQAPVTRSAAPGAELAAALQADPLEAACLLDAVHDPGGPRRYGYSPEARERLAAASRLIRGWQRRTAQQVADQIRLIAAESGLAVELQVGAAAGAPGAPVDDAGLVALLDVARQFDDVEGGRSLVDFLSWIDVADSIPDGPEAPARPQSDAVTVMTVHAAKGLEFPVVAVPGLVRGVFPTDRGRGLWPTTPSALPFDLLDEPRTEDAASFPEDPEFPRAAQYTAFTAACRAAERLEDVRLAYVALTRAKDRLILSGHRWGRTQVKPREPSEFLDAAARAAADGRADLDVWALPPDDGATNPLLAGDGSSGTQPAQANGPDWTGAAAAVLARADEAPPEAPEGPAGAVVRRWDRDLATLRAEAAQRRAPVPVPLPGDLSVSQWLAVVRDPAGFGLELARPVPRPVSRSAAAGTAFHAWVAALEDQLSLWETDDLIESTDVEPAQQQQSAMRSAFRASPFGALVPLAVEHEMAIAVDGRLVRGRIDAVYEIEGEHWVVDWKTGAAGTADPLQLALYRAAWAAERGVTPQRVVGCFVHVPQRRYDVYRDLPEASQLPRLLRGDTVARAPTATVSWEM